MLASPRIAVRIMLMNSSGECVEKSLASRSVMRCSWRVAASDHRPRRWVFAATWARIVKQCWSEGSRMPSLDARSLSPMFKACIWSVFYYRVCGL